MLTKAEAKKLVAKLGGREAIVQRLEQFATDVRLLDSMKAELVQQFPTQWAGVHKGKLVTVKASLVELLAELDNKHIPKGHAAIKYLDPEPKTLVLGIV